ncbi:helix-turn-helix domain-containing protein [Beijerinckia sp. L45]|uniref:winged helix-turn-helix transcriptional regulator n=1 Tax=Beijerinckia sp. L45 TaxID=1641855 RepID=UPI00131A7832|nr:helix-turn-helix domain-containing protein [Beijerinckia sp. L45]
MGARSIKTKSETSTHFKVPVATEDRAFCLGPDGAAAHVTRVLRMIQGRWKLPILFRLFADPTMRSSQLLPDMPDISQKMLTQHLSELEKDRLVERIDFAEKPLRVKYRLSEESRKLMPVLFEARRFSEGHPATQTDPTDAPRRGHGLTVNGICF